jgi:phage-related tail protein
MRDIDVHEAMSNLNPCSDKLGRDRDFKDAMNAFVKWTDSKIKELEKKIEELECQINNTQ